MPKPRRIELCLLIAGLCASAAAAGQTSVRRVQVLGGKDAVEIEIEASDRLVPQTRVLTGPDRLVVDFPNAVPGNKLRSQSVNRGEVKDVRVGLFQSSPPITRVVLDLNTPQSFQVFPQGRTVIIKVTGGTPPAATEVDDFPPVTRPGLVAASYAPGAARVPAEAPRLEVTFRNGLLAIKANKATLSEVMFAVHQRTGAEIAVAGGAEQERVAADLGPAPAAEVLAHMLNGSKFNFLILSSADSPGGLDRVILTPRGEGGGGNALQPMPMPVPVQNDDPGDEDAARAQNMETTPPPAVPVPPPAGQQLPPRNPPDTRPLGDDNTPDQ